MLCRNCCVDNLIGYGNITLSYFRCVKPLNQKSIVAKFATHASTHSTYLINGLVYFTYNKVDRGGGGGGVLTKRTS